MIQLRLQKELDAVDGKMLLDIDITIKQGSFVTFYGKSGAGKTSILRMLAGLLKVDKGLIKVNSKTWLDTEKRICLKPQQRKIGFMFQDYALFPNMTVKENLLFALDKGQNAGIVNELINIIELEQLQDKKPQRLSGGQQQRVALARAMVRKPEILMLDEPLSALDHHMRSKLQDYILAVHQKYAITTILISHDVSEVIKMSDHMFILDHGQITQQGSPLTIFTHHNNDKNIQFIGKIVGIQEKENSQYIVTLLTGTNSISIMIDEQEIRSFTIGDQVQVSSDVFKPVLKKIKLISNKP
ncbi:ATP-binding cassette domain-containing protein [Aquimarina sp. 2201CG1-2-11]|uniref:ABC transporter ATP-binding protein n=1 Tax=Aquimarina discodermiae TaxID=3231043 RepID=UPI0034629308